MNTELFFCYLLIVNAATFIIYGIDKWKARHDRWRVPESVLIFLAIIGGSPAAILAMRTFHHKTNKNKFAIGIPIILFLQLAALIFYACNQILGK